MTGGHGTITGTGGRPIIRAATEGDLPACAEIWRVAINDYTGPLGQPPIPEDHGPIRRLHRHLWGTDPERFQVAVARDDPGAGEQVVGFASAVAREDVWFLSMLFVLPAWQGAGLGRRLLDAVLPVPDRPARSRGTATDSAQPISNGLYASLGIVPRMPLLNLTGLPRRPGAFGDLPAGVTPVPFETVVARDGGHAAVAAAVDALDREIAGFGHPEDHRFLRLEDRHGFLYAGPDGGWLGYGYAGAAGRIGPIATRDPALVAPVVGHLMRAVEPRGSWSVWLPGAAAPAVVATLRAGLRVDGFPVLLCWDAPPADFERYLPISPGLL